MDEELAFVAESHAPIISTPTMDYGNFDPHPTHYPKVPERSSLRPKTRNSHVLSLPPVMTSSSRLSPTPTSESDGDGKQSDKVVRPVPSLPSFHHPHRTRASLYRDRGPETPPLTSPSHSSLNSNSAISQTSALHTPPHSPPAHSFVFTESTVPSSHLTVISEVSTPEDQLHRLSLHSAPAKSTQTLQILAKVDRPTSSSSAPAESEGQATITPRSVPRRLDAHLYLSETYSPTRTVTNVLLTSPTHTGFSTPDSATTLRLPSTPSSPSNSSFTSPGAGSGGIGWPFGNRSKTSLDAPPLTKAQKAEEKKRKKEEARVRKEQLAVELRRRTEARRAKADNASLYTTKSAGKSHPWEEDIAMFGGLASL
jgi:hypothetical protein